MTCSVCVPHYIRHGARLQCVLEAPIARLQLLYIWYLSHIFSHFWREFNLFSFHILITVNHREHNHFVSLQLQVAKYMFTLQQVRKTDLYKIVSEQSCHLFFNMACDFEVRLVRSWVLISKLKYFHFGRLLGDHCCVLVICISTVQYIGIQFIFLSHNVLSSADLRMLSSVVSGGQKLLAVLGYLGNSLVLSKADEHAHPSTDKGH